MEKNTEIKKNNQFTIPLSGCLYFIILCALASASIKGCKMVNMKYEEQKAKHEIVMDSINRVKTDTLYYKGR